MKEDLVPYTGQKFDCKMCGECCHCKMIPISNGDMERIHRFNSDKEFMEFSTSINAPIIARRDWDYGCIFLDDTKCSIHQYKPLICRLYPYAMYFSPIDEGDESGKRILPDGTKVYIYIDSSCPGVSATKTEEISKELIELVIRIRIEQALTRYYYDNYASK